MKKNFILISMFLLTFITNSHGILIVRTPPPANCSEIKLKTGEVIQATILQISPTEVKYKRCGKPEDPEIVINKSDVRWIKAPDGVVIHQDNTPKAGTAQNIKRKPNGFGVFSILLGIVSLILPVNLILFSLIGGLLSIIFGAMGLEQINRDPELYDGKIAARAGMILGFIVIAVICFLFLAAVA